MAKSADFRLTAQALTRVQVCTHTQPQVCTDEAYRRACAHVCTHAVRVHLCVQALGCEVVDGSFESRMGLELPDGLEQL